MSGNEIGALPELYRELHAAYGTTKLFEVVTTGAGNTSCETAGQAFECFGGYFAQIKSGHGEIHQEARRVLGRRRPCRARARYTDSAAGQVVTYSIWTHDLGSEGWMQWTHARQLIRIRRVAEPNDGIGPKTVGQRHYVTSRTPKQLNPMQALHLSRAHWRCENEPHWTADTQFFEDKRRLRFSRHPGGVLVVALLRAMAMVIMAVARKLSRTYQPKAKTAWAQVAEHFLLLMCATTLNTEAFDAV